MPSTLNSFTICSSPTLLVSKMDHLLINSTSSDLIAQNVTQGIAILITF